MDDMVGVFLTNYTIYGVEGEYELLYMGLSS
jgi:hypothetical protein